MHNIHVTSSVLSGVGYDGTTLEIKFNDGRLYRYYNVPQKEYDGLMSASSHGKYFSRNIRDHYRCRRII